MIPNSISSLDTLARTMSKMSLPTPILHKISFSSFLKAGLSLYQTERQHETEAENLIRTIPIPYRGLVNGKLYLNALNFVRSLNLLLRDPNRAVLLEEANLHYIIDFVKEKIVKVKTVMVFDCASIPEIVTIASKFLALNHHITIFPEIFINPGGITRFLTQQLKSYERKTVLAQYAKLLKENLNAAFDVKISTVDLVTHLHGYAIDEFLRSLDMQRLFDRINIFARQNSVLITSDHGYDLVAGENGLYITHGYGKVCPLNFSKIALFLVID